MTIEIANRLVELRRNRGLSQEELAEKLGISRQAVSKWERAESSPDIDNIIMLSRLYGVSVDELLCNENEASMDGSELLLQREEESGGGEPVGSGNGVRDFFCAARANLEIVGTDSDEFTVDIDGPEDEKARCRVFEEEGRLSVIHDQDESVSGFFGRRSGLNITVRMPRRMNGIEAELKGGAFMLKGVSAELVRAKVGGGRIAVEDAYARSLDLMTGGGSIMVRSSGAHGAVLRTGGGSIKTEEFSVDDRAEAKTGGGSIIIAGRMTEIEAVSGGGDVRLSLNGAERVDAKTGGGGIAVEMTGVGGARAELSTGGGRTSLYYKGEKILSGRRVEATVGDGSAVVKARSGGGSVKLSVEE